jgi:hypothetical protein
MAAVPERLCGLLTVDINQDSTQLPQNPLTHRNAIHEAPTQRSNGFSGALSAKSPCIIKDIKESLGEGEGEGENGLILLTTILPSVVGTCLSSRRLQVQISFPKLFQSEP